MSGYSTNLSVDTPRDDGTCGLMPHAGVRESRKFFSLVLGSVVTSQENNSDGSTEDLLSSLEQFLNKTWNIWGVSAMFNFDCNDDVKMKQYAKVLREEVANMLSQESMSYVAKFEVLDIPKPNDSDHPVIMIEVRAQTTNKETTENCVYEGYFFSWRSEVYQSSDNSTKLPLLLCRGTANTIRAVHSALGSIFDCTFVTLPATIEDLNWLLPILIRATEEDYEKKSGAEVMLEYTVPYLPNSNRITVKFHIKQLMKLWRSLWGSQDKIVDEEVEKFHKILYQQAKEVTGLQIELCMLYKIILPSITISANKMKVTSVNAMNTVLTYLNEKVMDALYINTIQFSSSK